MLRSCKNLFISVPAFFQRIRLFCVWCLYVALRDALRQGKATPRHDILPLLYEVVQEVFSGHARFGDHHPLSFRHLNKLYLLLLPAYEIKLSVPDL